MSSQSTGPFKCATVQHIPALRPHARGPGAPYPEFNTLYLTLDTPNSKSPTSHFMHTTHRRLSVADPSKPSRYPSYPLLCSTITADLVKGGDADGEHTCAVAEALAITAAAAKGNAEELAESGGFEVMKKVVV